MTDLIFDLGMNNGDDTDYYLKKGFRVVAVEANPSLCALGVTRFASEMQTGRLHIVNKAVSEVGGEIELFINEQVSGWTTTNPVWLKTRADAGTSSRRVVVQATTLPELLHEYGTPYYIKADIQGQELACLRALLNVQGRPKFISISTGVEVAGAYASGQVRKAIELFSTLGYRKFKIVQQNNTEFQKCPFPAREGIYVDYPFRHGCSGLFGRELTGEWLDATWTLREYWKIAMSFRLAGNSPWRWPHAWFVSLPSKTIRYYLDRVFWRAAGWYDTHAMHDDE
jgi:FkbM family methyltransferase